MDALFTDSSMLSEGVNSSAWKSDFLLSTNFQKSNSLVFVDSAIENAQDLGAEIAGTQAIFLDSKRDGIQQISEVLKESSNISSVYIISHGTEANLNLGTAQLNSNTLDKYSSPLQSWAQALNPDADILLYGCNVAATKTGVDFVKQVSDLTQADVAASDDLTGSAELGGDWQLEVTTGEIGSPMLQPTAYQGVLNIRIEAESMNLSRYRVESNSSASGGRLISLAGRNGRERGTATFEFSGSSGTYDVIAGYYDENDGTAQLQVEQNGSVLEAWNLDRDLGNNANETTFTTRTVATRRSLNRGDDFTLTGREQGGDSARVDYIEFVPVPTPSASTLALSASAYSVGEAGANTIVSVVRTGDTGDTITVDYNTLNDSATAGSDYTAVSGTLTFASGETRKDIAIPILEDTAVEGNESFRFVIDNVGGNGSLGAPRTAQITIADNDVPPDPILLTETNGSTQVTEGEGSDSYNLVLNRQPTANVTINVTPNSQVATNLSTLTFTPGNWNVAQTVTVTGVDDAAQEGNHTGTISHSVSSSDPTFNGVSLRDVTVAIADDDSGTFILETFAAGLTDPTAFDWSPDGQRMYVAQKNGVVRVINNGTLSSTPFIDISREVNNVRDRGLLGIAVHPDLVNNPYVYLAYTYDPPEAQGNTGLAAPDGAGNRPSRLIRVTADASTNYTTAVAGSAVVILGTNSTWANTSRPDGNSTNDLTIPPSGINPDGTNIQDYLATDSESHTIGDVEFGSDGSLFVSNGDGTSYNAVDPRTVRVQDIGNLSGKLLRIDPITGDGLSDNPFYNGNPDSNQSKVYNYGLRNPFRFTINDSSNRPFIGDVGWTDWEEVNTGRGVNFGWPYFEGGNNTSIRRAGYSDLPEAQAFYNSGQPVTAATYARAHSAGAVAIVMGDFYTGTTFPDFLDNTLFFSDFGDNTVRYLTFNESGGVASVNTFATGISGIVQMKTGPDSNLYFANLVTGQIGRWRYDDTVSSTPNRQIDRRSRIFDNTPNTSFLTS
jgi:glucose/arabinose dehydrogenase